MSNRRTMCSPGAHGYFGRADHSWPRSRTSLIQPGVLRRLLVLRSGPALTSYVTYLQLSRQRRRRRHWYALASPAGFRPVPAGAKTGGRPTLRVLAFRVNHPEGQLVAVLPGSRPPAVQPAGARPRPKITVFSYSYPPGYLAGGPARSVHALVETLADDFSFAVVTSALDGPAATCVMPSVQPDQWSTHGHARVWFESSARPSARTVARLLRDSEPDVIYLNSLFDYRFTLLPLMIAHLTSRRA